MSSRIPLPRGRFAILDLFSMFLGVFLAFALDNYREDIEKRTREREYLSAMLCEVSDEVAELLRVDSIYSGKVVTMKDYFRASREREAVVPTDSLNELFKAFVFRYPFPSGHSSVYESMQSSGDLSLVRNKAFVKQLVRQSQSRRELVEQGHILLDHTTKAFHTQLHDDYDYRLKLFVDPRLLRHPRLLSIATMQQSATRDYVDILGIHLARTIELRQALDSIAVGGCK